MKKETLGIILVLAGFIFMVVCAEALEYLLMDPIINIFCFILAFLLMWYPIHMGYLDKITDEEGSDWE